MRTTSVRISTRSAVLDGDLNIPDYASGLVVFVHGSGSSRFSKRNRYVAAVLNDGGLGTLLMDLLTPEEESADRYTAEYRFDIPRLSRRVVDTLDWLEDQDWADDLPVGLFGSSTGAAAALYAASRRPERVAAIVSRGGRPDLAMDELDRVEAPTLLLVGGHDEPVITMNREAGKRLAGEHELVIVAGATHLFEEPGKLEEVAGKARDWFVSRMTRRNDSPA